jgi:D-arginine dehydrogenase
VVVDLSRDGYDLVVVGAGIVGAAVATQARLQRPSARTLLVDRSQAGSGATRHSAALSPPIGATPAHRRLAERADRWYAELEREGEVPPRRRLAAFWVVPQAGIPGFQEQFVSGHPVPAASGDLARLRDAYPDLAVRPDETVWCSDGVWAGAAEVTARSLAARLNQAGGSACWEGVEVDEIRPEEGGFVLLTRTGQRLRARHVVLATGPWLADDPGQGRAGWALRVKKVAALHLSRRPRRDDPAVVFWEEDTFLLPVPDRGVTLFSFCCQTWDVHPSASLVLERPDLDAAVDVLAARSAGLAAGVAGGRAFCDGYLPGHLPQVTEDPARPGLLLAGGCSGSGFRLAPALAELAVAGLDRFAGS